MAERVVLIRAVNVGGAKLPMADLRELAEELGAADVSTYIASGNLLCTPRDDPAMFDRALETAIEQRFGYFREVVSRSPGELAEALASYPFEVTNPKFSHIHFLPCEPSADAIAALEAVDLGEDRLQVIGRDVHIDFANGAGQSKLTAATLARKLGVQGTARNLLSVRKLISLAG